MSQYLIDRIQSAPNIEVLTHREIASLEGDDADGLRQVTCVSRSGEETLSWPIRNLFLFTGADPDRSLFTGLSLAVDAAGFILTGAAASESVGEPRRGSSALSLQTSASGVFAVGDIRAGSVKRVGAAIGEGAAAVSQIHRYLATH